MREEEKVLFRSDKDVRQHLDKIKRTGIAHFDTIGTCLEEAYIISISNRMYSTVASTPLTDPEIHQRLITCRDVDTGYVRNCNKLVFETKLPKPSLVHFVNRGTNVQSFHFDLIRPHDKTTLPNQDNNPRDRFLPRS